METQNFLLNLSGYLPPKYLSPSWQIFNQEKINEIFKNKNIFAKIFNFYKKICWPKYDELIVLIPTLEWQNKKLLIDFIIWLARSKKKYLIDNNNLQTQITTFTIFKNILLLFLEIIFTPVSFVKIYCIVIFLSCFSPKELIFSLSNKRIAYLRTDLWFNVKAGGSINHIAGVINAFIKQGYQVRLFSTDKLENLNYQTLNFIKILPSKIFTAFAGLNTLFLNEKFYRQSKRNFSKDKFDFIYQRYSLGNFCGVRLKIKFNLPFILEYNGSEIWINKNWGSKPLPCAKLFIMIENINFKFADLIVVVSRAMRDELIARGIPQNKILVNPNGVNPVEFNPQVDENIVRNQLNFQNKIIVGFIGTFGHWHGVNLLAESIKPVIKRNPHVHYLFIGEGSEKNKVIDIIKNDHVQNNVTLTGFIPPKEAPEYLAACDILVTPTLPNKDGSRFFGSPTKLFEYMAMGKAIIASDLEQLGEILENNQSALLIKPGNIHELIDAIIKLSADKSLRSDLGTKARSQVIKNFTWDKNVQRILDTIQFNGKFNTY